jgi:hypothetical protein
LEVSSVHGEVDKHGIEALERLNTIQIKTITMTRKHWRVSNHMKIQDPLKDAPEELVYNENDDPILKALERFRMAYLAYQNCSYVPEEIDRECTEAHEDLLKKLDF